ncbi:MAG: hypothetical protein KF753_06340 [Caldilineaceae bacterium]|nr:hypothetical protein [Caldilineaceae bacterium]
MKAIRCTELSGPDGLRLADLPDPSAGPGQVIVVAATYPLEDTGAAWRALMERRRVGKVVVVNDFDRMKR